MSEKDKNQKTGFDMKRTDFTQIFSDAHELAQEIRKQQAIEEARRDVAEIERLVNQTLIFSR